MRLTCLRFSLNKHLTLLVLLITTIAFSQNDFRTGSSFIINENNLQDALKKCSENLGKPIVSERDSNTTTNFSFNTKGGKLFFIAEKEINNVTGAIIIVNSEIVEDFISESDWISDFINKNSIFKNGETYLKNSKLKFVKFVDADKKTIFISFGNIDLTKDFSEIKE